MSSPEAPPGVDDLMVPGNVTETGKENVSHLNADFEAPPPPPPRASPPFEADPDPELAAHDELIARSVPTTDLEIALTAVLRRKHAHIERLTNEIDKLKAFVSKRKQTYKRKRKEEGAPTRALSAYNIFIQDRFAKLAKENENALKSDDAEAQLKRVPPSNLVASTGTAWKELSDEVKAQYEERYVTCSSSSDFFSRRFDAEHVRIASVMRKRWQHISHLTNKPIVKETRRVTTCFSQLMCFVLNSPKPVCHPKEDLWPVLWARPGKSLHQTKNSTTNAKQTSTTECIL